MAISYTSGIPHTSGAPTHNPGATGGRICYDITNNKWYKHVSGTTWEETLNAAAGYDGERVVNAGENVSAGRVVVIIAGEAFYFQPTTSAHAGLALGVTKNAATIGNSVTVAFDGEVTDAGFSSFADSPLWAAANGVIQTTIPASGTIQKVGFGVGSNTIIIDKSIQITRP